MLLLVSHRNLTNLTTHFVMGHGEVKMALTGKLLSQWLTFLVYGKVLYRELRDKSHQ